MSKFMGFLSKRKEMALKKKWLFLFFIATLYSTQAFGMTVEYMGTAADSAQNFAQSIVGSGVTISNVSYSGYNRYTWSSAFGYFSDGIDAGIGIESGIVLTTGSAGILKSTNTKDDSGAENFLFGDSDLDALIPGYKTYDASILSFDFVSTGDTASFRYVFGSEEYNEWVRSTYNDVFGFFIDGVNYALIPGTTTPVSINNVNGSENSDYYNDNDPSENRPYTPYEIAYDGFTDVLTANFTDLIAGETYTLKLAIADAGDYILDSGVFIETGSFSSTSTVPVPSTLLLLSSGLAGLAGVRRKLKK